jgi:hypothetical protein
MLLSCIVALLLSLSLGSLVKLKQFYVEILLGSTATALSSLIRPC